MMTREMVLELLATLGDDVEVDECGSDIHVTVQDFGGYDEHWSEIERELDDADAVDAVFERLVTEALDDDGDFYRYFQFDGFTVVWGYESMDV